MFFLFWQQGVSATVEISESSAGGAGKFHKKNRTKRRSPPFFELPPVTKDVLPTPPKPKPPTSTAKRKPLTAKPIDISRFLINPKSEVNLTVELLKGIAIPGLALEMPPLPKKLLPEPDIGIESPILLRPPKSALKPINFIEAQNIPIQNIASEPKIQKVETAETTLLDDDLILWLAALDGEPDAMVMLITKE